MEKKNDRLISIREMLERLDERQLRQVYLFILHLSRPSKP